MYLVIFINITKEVFTLNILELD